MKKFVRTISNYPIHGVEFRDITTLLQDAKLFARIVDEMTEPWVGKKIDAILSIESRGFIMAGAIAYKLKSAFIPLRKPNKLPYKTHMVSYDLEYGQTEMHIHTDSLEGHNDLLIIDDLLATGGTAIAAVDLIDKFKGKNIVGAGFIINLPSLNGEKRLIERNVSCHSMMEF
ncbi:MAG: adenine phosphoribosyltransferase [Proteobacteria bacterium]|jgi:adenine phosphoribosyltransferase|nr:adenine phosphoribosyltransferase [Pseudomonadota bacterium]MDA1238196.1 adenine phosphoribosyltransferase [Pseudomonadota bacterium]